MVVVNRADRAAKCLSALAATNPAVLRLLVQVAGMSVYAELAFVAGDIVIAAGVESRVVPMNHPLALNIRPEIELYLKVAEEAQQAAQRRQGVDLAQDLPHVVPGGPAPGS
jgi:hypothetical protein